MGRRERLTCAVVLVAAHVLLATASPVNEGKFSKMPLRKKPTHRLVSRRLMAESPKFHAHVWEEVTMPDGSIHDAVSKVEISGGITSLGMYYTYIQVGGQQVDLQIDTGSSTMALPRADCTNCRRGDHRYNPESSKGTPREILCHDSECRAAYGACTGNSCRFSLAYADKSGANGVLMCDSIDWGDIKNINGCFGAITDDSENFEREGVDGILGLADKSLACNPSCIEPIFDVAVRDNKVAEDAFTICLDDEGGSLTLGGADSSVFQGDISYQRMIDSSFYSIFLSERADAIKVGDELIPTSLRTLIVDTGTTLLTVPRSVFEEMKRIFTTKYCEVPELCGPHSWFNSGLCVNFDADAEDDILDNQLPKITFELESGFVIELTGRDYLVKYEHGGKHYRCLGMMYLSTASEFLFGNTFMLKYSTVYDREKKRLGIGLRAKTCH
eukprot:Plantae.Rhodophyta-Purpureofilum_apyrenoidigerum.ctg11420.p1 GENE.Plantae.Rhodophyta-Purpureofilum_apyrenoidigerum.ctg11420~~Plantae.Rhodophyta-Purpureofilum_apyrenoidigerum.ctg11420.p1  ORF type:complete len:443 (-),score=39.37 Plantae.Rhodophyta-Purpureofilum_apyrenoidigerum.ctg11420:38-1366(-)